MGHGSGDRHQLTKSREKKTFRKNLKMETRSKKRKNSGSNGGSGKKIKEESQSLLVRQETKIMDLPDEILLEIMSYLTTNDVVENVAKVSTKFQRLSDDEILIAKIKLNDEEEEAEEEEEDDEYHFDGYDCSGCTCTCSKCRADWSFDEDDWFLNPLGSSDEEDDDE